MGNVKELHRYPVKSMLGEQLRSCAIDSHGLAGDRVWAVRDDKTTLTGKKFPALMSAQASFTESVDGERRSPAARITLPDGQTLQTGDADTNTRLSEWLDHTASLWPLVDPENLDVFRRAATPGATPEQIEAGLREVFARLPDEPLPDLASFPAELMTYESPPGTWFDALPILLVSSNALTTLSRNAHEKGTASNFDLRRFRPNIVVDGLEGDFPENDLVGKQCQIGDAVLAIEMECPRCIMTTHPVAELPKDPGIMRQLVQQNGGNLGVYARVIQAGTVREGDHLTVLGEAAAT